MSKTYLCFDVEASGPVPGLYYMASLGVVPVILDAEKWRPLHDNGFYAEFRPAGEEIESAMQIHKLTTSYLMEHGEKPAEAMARLHGYTLGWKKPRWVAWPTSFDFPWINWYAWKHLGRGVFGHSALDAGSFVQGMLGPDYRKVMKKRGFRKFTNEHKHHALWDAKELAHLCAWVLNAQKGITKEVES